MGCDSIAMLVRVAMASYNNKLIGVMPSGCPGSCSHGNAVQIKRIVVDLYADRAVSRNVSRMQRLGTVKGCKNQGTHVFCQ